MDRDTHFPEAVVQPSQHYLGIDPDLHSTALAIISRTPDNPDGMVSIKKVKIIRIPDSLKKSCPAVYMAITPNLLKEDITVSGLAMEGQEVFSTRMRGGNPQDIIHLAQMAGVLMQKAVAAFAPKQVFMPEPVQWKGSVPKEIHHARICRRLGLEYSLRGGTSGLYAVPKDHKKIAPDINAGDWKHAMDAVGLALYAMDRFSLQN